MNISLICFRSRLTKRLIGQMCGLGTRRLALLGGLGAGETDNIPQNGTFKASRCVEAIGL